MGKVVRLDTPAAGRFGHVASVAMQAGILRDEDIRVEDDKTYASLAFHPLFLDLLLAVRLYSLEFYNVATLEQVKGVNLEVLQRFRVGVATFLNGPISLEPPVVERPGDDAIVLFSNVVPGDFSVYAYSLASQRIVAKFDGFKSPIRCIVSPSKPQNRCFVAASADGQVIYWKPGDTKNKELMADTSLHFEQSSDGISCCFNDDGRVLIVVSGREVYFFNTDSMRTPFRQFSLDILEKQVSIEPNVVIVDIAIPPIGSYNYIALRLSNGEVIIVDRLTHKFPTVAYMVIDPVVKTIGKGGMSFANDGYCLLIPCEKPYIAIIEEYTPTPEDDYEPKVLKPLSFCCKETEAKCCPVVFIPGLASVVVAGNELDFYEYKDPEPLGDDE